MRIFHKIKIGFERLFTRNSIEVIPEQKSFGNNAEIYFAKQIKHLIPNCVIKTNVIVDTSYGNCEIDSIIQFKNKLFIVEIKNWKGLLMENDTEFISKKQDKYTGEIYTKKLKSPFAQIKRQIFLLKKYTNTNPWINPIIYFCNAANVIASRKVEWFTTPKEIANYIINEGQDSFREDIDTFMYYCKEADVIYASSSHGERSLRCRIDTTSLCALCKDIDIEISRIARMNVFHHFSYDDVDFYFDKGQIIRKRVENGKLIAIDTEGNKKIYSLCKVETVIFGKQ